MLIPPILLSTTTSGITSTANWTTQDQNDPWVGVPYQWSLTMNIVPQYHSYPLSQTPYSFNGNDIKVGDWYSDLTSGKAVQIISITSQNATSATVVVEDVDRFNTFTDNSSNGIGIGPVGNGYIFQLGDDGIPVLGPMSGFSTQLNKNVGWQLDQISRFRYRNYISSHYSVNQPGNTFAVNQPIYLQPSGSYSIVPPASADAKNYVGIVTDIGIPAPGYFSYKSAGKVIKNVSPSLPGNAGDIIYIGTNGYTNVAPAIWARPIYINLGNGDGILLQNGVDVSGTNGFVTQSSVIANNTALAALTPNSGDTALVESADVGGEWNHVIYNGSSWIPLSTEASSTVDAQTLQCSVGTSLAPVVVGTVGIDRCVVVATVTVSAAFNTGTTLNIGTQNTPNSVMNSSLIDLTQVGTYTCNPNIILNSTNYTEIFATISGRPTNGAANVNITYI